ncbi:hypothetical protein CDAR_506811 [Caerostris darwini]|uniref:Uncharacterized protein n=1 Tax=Caerostris darwini TaxID=1538125 RepID=A0AAV4NZX5_9ARAC|nr:hypothetical protein CDAR_506811 [Caerostris darwini]
MSKVLTRNFGTKTGDLSQFQLSADTGNNDNTELIQSIDFHLTLKEQPSHQFGYTTKYSEEVENRLSALFPERRLREERDAIGEKFRQRGNETISPIYCGENQFPIPKDMFAGKRILLNARRGSQLLGRRSVRKILQSHLR